MHVQPIKQPAEPGCGTGLPLLGRKLAETCGFWDRGRMSLLFREPLIWSFSQEIFYLTVCQVALRIDDLMEQWEVRVGTRKLRLAQTPLECSIDWELK